MTRRIAIAVPARNEAERIDACLEALANLKTDHRVGGVTLVVAVNNSADATVSRARGFGRRWRGNLDIRKLTLPADRAHAGWARRLALDAASLHLRRPRDVLMSTDADTIVDPNWLVATLDHLDAGYDAVAGLARLDPRELRALPREHRRRLALIRRYQNALTWLETTDGQEDGLARHSYEGGASIALTLRAYRLIGGAPTPPVGEDKALFSAIRAAGGKVRHARDVAVRTSARLKGRAPGGASDTLALWGRQNDNEPIAHLANVSAGVDQARHGRQTLSFAELADETRRVRAMIERARRARTFNAVG